MNNHHTIHNLFTAWGRRERQLPPHHEAMKHRVLAGLENLPYEVGTVSHRVPWWSLAFTGLAALTLLINSGWFKGAAPFVEISPAGESRVYTPSTLQPQAPASQKEIMPDYFPRPWPEPNVPITDTREFLKTDYHATIRTRRVGDLTRRVETTVRGFGGRVDSTTNSPRFGFVSFVVPASKFDAFQREVEGLVGPRFLTAAIRAENLLPHKQLIEGQKKQVAETLGEFRADRQKIVADHNRAVLSLQSPLNTITYELVLLRAEQTNDPVRKAQIAAREQELVREQEMLQTRLANENASYTKQLNVLDAKIRETETDLERVNAQDQNLLDTVATVRGTISLNWISIGEVIQLYISPYWISLTLVLAAIISYVLHRRRYRVVIP